MIAIIIAALLSYIVAMEDVLWSTDSCFKIRRICFALVIIILVTLACTNSSLLPGFQKAKSIKQVELSGDEIQLRLGEDCCKVYADLTDNNGNNFVLAIDQNVDVKTKTPSKMTVLEMRPAWWQYVYLFKFSEKRIILE